MATPLRNLTLTLSRDLSALHADCRGRIRRLEDERAAALGELPEARMAVRAFAAATRKAKVSLEKAELKIAADLDKAEGKASRTRREELLEVDRAFRAADPYRAKRNAIEKAEALYREALDTIWTNVPLLAQQKARADARRILRKARDAAERAYRKAAHAAADERRQEHRLALAEERGALAAARQTAERGRKGAEHAYQTAVRQAERELRADLRGTPEADRLRREFDRRLRELRKDCRAREAAMLEQFRQDKTKAPKTGKRR